MKSIKASRKCPICNDIIEYYSMNSFYRARSKNSSCYSCCKAGDKNPFYGKQFSDLQISKWKKERSGEGNPMYGTDGGMKGKKQSDHQKSNQVLYMKNRWAKIKNVSVDNLQKDWSEYKKYRNTVDLLTRKLPLHLLENFEKRGKAGQDGAYHVDHIISVYKGFKLGIPPEEIATMSNLQMLPWLENQKKWYK